MAGPPFDVLEKLATPKTAVAAGNVLTLRKHYAQIVVDLRDFLRTHRTEFSAHFVDAWRKAARAGVPPAKHDSVEPVFTRFREASAQLRAAEEDLEQKLAAELKTSRSALYESARTVLPRYLVFLDSALRQRLEEQTDSSVVPPRNKKQRAHERHLALYLQRVCAKNDSLSEFGPEGWGTVEDKQSDAPSLQLNPIPGISGRETFLERWTAHGVAAALNADPDVRLEVAPRLNPVGLLHGSSFVCFDNGESLSITAAEADLLARCDGATPAWSLGQTELLEDLAKRGVLLWQLEVPAMDPHAFDALLDDVREWREGAPKAKWLPTLEALAALPRKFAAAATPERARIMDEARHALEQLGSSRTSTNRILYAAINPIGEECVRECGFSLGHDLLDEVARDAAPWFDLWHDSYCFIASRVAAGLRAIFAKAPQRDGAVPLPAFLSASAAARLPLQGPGLPALAHLAFQEVKAAFREQFKNRLESDEWDLSADDCHFVRRNFEFERFDEYTYPSADLQLSARSVEAIRDGEYQWIVAELHPPTALLQHGFYWGCPDKDLLGREVRQATGGRPTFHFGFFAVDFTSPTTVHLADSMGDLVTFVAPQRVAPDWRVLPPAETEVYVDPESNDVCLRRCGTREYLGSFSRNWIIQLGFHPFQFNRPGHVPRLRCGRVIVQRRTWTFAQDELPALDYSGVSHSLVVAVEEARARLGLPRYLFIRPSEQALRRSGAEGRDKDTKPVFIDLESYISIEIFYRWLTKAGELEVTEMLPDPEHLFWQEADGRRSFELRTLLLPRP